MKASIGNILIGAIALIVVLNMTMFVVDQRQAAIVLQLGEMVSVKTEPGLHFKIPLAQNVRYFDA
ncbi:MAG: SPFH domain-containing protein, partial [Candidatus Nitrotoga sp.]